MKHWEVKLFVLPLRLLLVDLRLCFWVGPLVDVGCAAVLRRDGWLIYYCTLTCVQQYYVNTGVKLRR